MSRQIHVGKVPVGGGAPVVVQSMTSTSLSDEAGTFDQVTRLAVEGSPLPVIADIHFDYRLALAAIEHGVAGVRVNPGTIGSERQLRQVILAAKEGRPRQGGPGPVAVRIGVNAGSLPRRLRAWARHDPTEAMVSCALEAAERCREWGFEHFKLSVKSSSVPETIAAYRLLAERSDAPLHVGVTEAGTVWSGTIKSAVGIGTLLAEGIGDTIRVSLTGDPVEEVRVAWQILAALELRRRGPNLISCPTCGRTELDLAGIAGEVERRLQAYTAPITVAVMGCRVNGPEEARHADFGIAGGRGEGIVFARGEKIATVPEDELVERLFAEIDRELERKKRASVTDTGRE